MIVCPNGRARGNCSLEVYRKLGKYSVSESLGRVLQACNLKFGFEHDFTRFRVARVDRGRAPGESKFDFFFVRELLWAFAFNLCLDKYKQDETPCLESFLLLLYLSKG
jgi:hypothetical protein